MAERRSLMIDSDTVKIIEEYQQYHKENNGIKISFSEAVRSLLKHGYTQWKSDQE